MDQELKESIQLREKSMKSILNIINTKEESSNLDKNRITRSSKYFPKLSSFQDPLLSSNWINSINQKTNLNLNRKLFDYENLKVTLLDLWNNK